jgi:hydroxyacylglutathione hydrolase
MNINILYQNNSLRNYNYILACPTTREAAVIDPLNADMCLQLAQQQNLTITTIINTHEHFDHIEGNPKIIAATGAKVIAHANASIPDITQRAYAGDIINIGSTIQLQVLDTPGHTFSHICLLSINTPTPALFSGDTLFNAGCGNCRSGNVDLMYKTFTEQLYLIADHTQVYPGHDYLANNLQFALSREPNNAEIHKWIALAEKQDPQHPLITTLAIEKQINPFFRLDSPEIIQQLHKDFASLPEKPNAYEVFVGLRELRNNW